MNTDAQYHRHSQQLEQADAGAIASHGEAANHIAIHGDPSLALTVPTVSTAASGVAPTGKRIAWVRPTELASLASPLIGRGIDLHAELARQAQQSPRTLIRSVCHRAPRPSPAPSPTQTSAPTNRQEGLQL